MPRSLQKHHKGMISNIKRARKRAKTGQRRRRLQKIVKTSRKEKSSKGLVPLSPLGADQVQQVSMLLWQQTLKVKLESVSMEINANITDGSLTWKAWSRKKRNTEGKGGESRTKRGSQAGKGGWAANKCNMYWRRVQFNRWIRLPKVKQSNEEGQE